jgi:ATP-binding cassette subfamily F protein uup
MTIINVQSLKKDFGIKEIVKNASFSIEDTDKIGLIGVNGSGKSTLLKIIAGLEPADAGEMTFKSGAKIVYLPQQPIIDPDCTVLEQVFAGSPQMQLIGEYEDLSHKIAQVSADDVTNLMTKLAQISEKIENQGIWDLDTRAKIILTKLGIEDLSVKMGKLSGGYCKRIALATALMSEPDLLLMDEPTNHLDASSVEWLQEYLKQFRGAIFLITHDRYFLDQVTNRILELDRGEIYGYGGNYSYYLEKKALAEESEASSQKKFKGVLRRELEWLKRGPKARSTKQKARIGRVEEMQNTTFREAQGKVEIDTPGRRIGTKIIELFNISKSFGDRTIIKDFTYEFSKGDRIGIIGENGAGKSTFLNLITNRIEPDQGTVEIGSTIHIGYFDQHSEDLLTEADNNKRVIDYIKDVAAYVQTADGTQITASQMLERFLFTPNQQYAPIHKLSGGEKRRLFLLKMLMDAPNVLLLDEPTNDLDVQTLGVLEEYIESFNGCVIVVSHDRYFLDRTVNTIFALEANGNLRQYTGNYSDYLEIQKQQQTEIKANTETKPAESTKQQKSASSNNKPRRLSNYQRQELDKLESTIIPDLETQKAELEQQLYHNPPQDYTQLESLTADLDTLNQKLEQATEKWLELAEINDYNAN